MAQQATAYSMANVDSVAYSMADVDSVAELFDETTSSSRIWRIALDRERYKLVTRAAYSRQALISGWNFPTVHVLSSSKSNPTQSFDS
jgi:hypothetical protein